jgi:hypothetical protein
MIRALEAGLWMLGAGTAIAFYLLAGFYGWATVFVWTGVVFPVALWSRSGDRVSTGLWSSRAVLVWWCAACVASVLAGILPMIDVSARGASVQTVMVVGIGWIAALLSVVLISVVTIERIVSVVRSAKRAV